MRKACRRGSPRSPPAILRDVLRVEFDPERSGRERLTWSIDQDAVERLDLDVFGKRILMTDQHDWTSEEIILAYRGQHELEAAFRQVKDPTHLAVRPQFHWTESSGSISSSA